MSGDDELGQGAFDRARARLALAVGPALFLLVWFAPLPLEGAAHPVEAQRLAAIMVLVVTFWVGEPVPVAVTALLGPTLALVLGAIPGVAGKDAARVAFAQLGNPILLLFIGGFFIAEAMTVHGLDRRFAMNVLALRAFGASTRRMVIGLGVCAWALSMWVNNTATTALLIPIAGGMLSVAAGGGAPSRGLEAPCMLMIAFAATVGGLATPVGTAPNLIGLSQLEQLAGARVPFVHWMALTLPLTVAMMICLAVLLTRGLPPSAVDLRAHAVAERARLGPWRRGEVVTAVAFGLAVGLWMASGLVQLRPESAVAVWFQDRLPEGAIAIVASSLLFLIPAAPGRPTLTWREAARIDWGTLLLLGGGLALGDLMRRTGLVDVVGVGVVRSLGIESLWVLTFVAALMASGLSELISNTATATILLPVVIEVARQAGVDPLPPAIAATCGCSFGFMLPVSTPPNALVYGTGRIPISFMIKRGFMFDVAGAFIIVVGLRLLWPLFGR
ncbi:MAG: DASS family sodium-coupled anion symporter [Planctomycetes bacterium]|nr:DASS family sodium-coupled anion symporter [Planctomycetota bacterium]